MTSEMILIIKLIKGGICVWLVILGVLFILSQQDKSYMIYFKYGVFSILGIMLLCGVCLLPSVLDNYMSKVQQNEVSERNRRASYLHQEEKITEIRLSDVVRAITDNYDSDEEYVYSVAIEDGDRVGWSTDLIRKKISFFFKEDAEKNIVINLYSDYKSETMRIGRVKCESFDMGNYDKLECLLIKAYSNNLPFVIDMSARECEEALYKGELKREKDKQVAQ